jgi:hypothetical protein
MKDEYTMAEFIKEFKLGVDIHDTTATKLVAKKLQSLGYRRVLVKDKKTKNSRPIWSKRHERLEGLKHALEAIK